MSPIDIGPLLELAPFSFSSSVSRYRLLPPPGDGTELEEKPPPVSFPFYSGMRYGQGPLNLSSNSTSIYRLSKRNKVLSSA